MLSVFLQVNIIIIFSFIIIILCIVKRKGNVLSRQVSVFLSKEADDFVYTKDFQVYF